MSIQEARDIVSGEGRRGRLPANQALMWRNVLDYIEALEKRVAQLEQKESSRKRLSDDWAVGAKV